MLTRSFIRSELPVANRAALKRWRTVLNNRRLDYAALLPEWPGLAQSLERDLRAIDARLDDPKGPS